MSNGNKKFYSGKLRDIRSAAFNIPSVESGFILGETVGIQRRTGKAPDEAKEMCVGEFSAAPAGA